MYGVTQESVIIPDTVDYIDIDAFNGCTSLTSVILSDGLEYIGDNAFSGCTALQSLVIPNSVGFIGEDAFNGVGHVYYNGESDGSHWGALAVN